MNKIIAALVALILACGLGAGAVYHWQHAKVQAAEKARDEAQAALKRQKTTVVYREKLRVVHEAAKAQETASLAAAVASAPDWANTPVPKEVQDALAP